MEPTTLAAIGIGLYFLLAAVGAAVGAAVYYAVRRPAADTMPALEAAQEAI